jgi:protein-disulfide isomerase
MNRFDRKTLVPGALALILALGVWLPACSAQDKAGATEPKGSGEVLATVNGEPVTEAEVRELAKDQFANLEREFERNQRELLESTLDRAVQERLLEMEAKARGVSKEQLLTSIQPTPVTDADVDKFYEENKARIPRPKEEIAPQIKQFLEQQGQQTARQDFYSQLQDKYDVQVKLEPIRVEVAATGPAKGPENAPVTIVEFSDFECPFCGRVNPTLEQVQQKYGDKVRIVFRQFPLAMHANAQKAAEASLCAHEQGKFWELHDAMFQNQQALGVDQLKAKAAELGLEAEKFNQCLDSGQFASQVQADMQAGSAAGVSGTPALFVNGRLISGAVPIDQIAPVIDDELRRKGISPSGAEKGSK